MIHPPISGESEEKCTFVEPTVDKALYVDGTAPPSAEFSEPTNVDEAYADWREGIDLSQIRCASLKRRIMAILEQHTGMYTRTLRTI